jgi:cobalamin-dependent methionine synthase I
VSDKFTPIDHSRKSGAFTDDPPRGRATGLPERIRLHRLLCASILRARPSSRKSRRLKIVPERADSAHERLNGFVRCAAAFGEDQNVVTAIQAPAIETAEGCADWLHRRIREDWGFPDPPSTTMQERFTSRYRGKRYSFGYPACPNLEDQEKLWRLLKPDEIGVHLTEGFMMEPEASVSALAFHHPDCAYFTATEGAEAA